VLLIDPARPIQWYQYGFTALVFSLGALGMSVLNERAGGRAEIAAAYLKMAVAGGILAGMSILGRTAAAFADAAPALVSMDWPVGAGLAALCSLLYVHFAVRFRQPPVL